MAKDITNSEDVIDLRDVIERFEELEGNRKPWRAGWNMPGYMPDSEPAGFETWEDARDYIVEDLERQDDGETTSYELAAAIEALRNAKDGEDFGSTHGNWHYWIAKVDGDAFEDESEAPEYDALKELLEDLCARGGDEQWRGDWYPISLIRDSYFQDYAEQLADDIGAINSNATWPNNCIDWEQAARELQQDYSSVEYDGVTYWYR